MTEFGDRMKFYEKQESGRRLIPLLPVCARMDGRSFHSFTASLDRPFDKNFRDAMIQTTLALVKETNALIGYTQSDEISLIWHETNFKSQIFFDGKIQKMCSILAALSTSFFQHEIRQGDLRHLKFKFPIFDARVWNVPLPIEAVNYLVWREADATRNSVSMVAQSLYSHKQLQNKSSKQMQEMIFQKDINWNDYPANHKRGTYVRRVQRAIRFSAEELEKLPLKHAARENPELTMLRSVIEIVEWPPLAQIENRADVIFGDAEPLLKG
jgi:tRNA(His) 5'-end guanylyltransferase